MSDSGCRGHGSVTATERLCGGTISATSRIRTTTGTSYVLKESVGLPRDLYRLEAQGLRQLASAYCLLTPTVHLHGRGFLLLKDLGNHAWTAGDWTALGHGLARLHQQTGELFGYHNDNYLGSLAQRNPWTADGPAFFAEHRLLRWLDAIPGQGRRPGRRAEPQRQPHRLGRLRHLRPLPGQP
ncbi:fructosamine kinase family protein [Streptomyces sp. NPDC060022]|uniref:fructosamine kinase family protein n=1 Tax=Streptomyces sp. NPDC060022 TaxID=3347039 RepID=UPI0036AB3167